MVKILGRFCTHQKSGEHVRRVVNTLQKVGRWDRQVGASTEGVIVATWQHRGDGGSTEDSMQSENTADDDG